MTLKDIANELKKKLQSFTSYALPQTMARVASGQGINRVAQGISQMPQSFRQLPTLANVQGPQGLTFRQSVAQLPQQAEQYWLQGKGVTNNPIIPTTFKQPLKIATQLGPAAYMHTLASGVGALAQNKPGIQKAGDIAGVIGALNPKYAASNLFGGPMMASFQALQNVYTKKPIGENLIPAWQSGQEFSFKLGPIGELAGNILKPILKFISPVELQSINKYLELAKSATTVSARNEMLKLMAKRIMQNLTAEGIQSGVGMGIFGATMPAKDREEQINNILQQGFTGVAFGIGTKSLGYGIQGGKFTLKNVKPPNATELNLGLNVKAGGKPLGTKETIALAKRKMMENLYDAHPEGGLTGEVTPGLIDTLARRDWRSTNNIYEQNAIKLARYIQAAQEGTIINTPPGTVSTQNIGKKVSKTLKIKEKKAAQAGLYDTNKPLTDLAKKTYKVEDWPGRANSYILDNGKFISDQYHLESLKKIAPNAKMSELADIGKQFIDEGNIRHLVVTENVPGKGVVDNFMLELSKQPTEAQMSAIAKEFDSIKGSKAITLDITQGNNTKSFVVDNVNELKKIINEQIPVVSNTQVPARPNYTTNVAQQPLSVQPKGVGGVGEVSAVPKTGVTQLRQTQLEKGQKGLTQVSQQPSKTLPSSIAQKETLDLVKGAIDSGDEAAAKDLYSQIKGSKPSYENLVKEVEDFQSGLMKEAKTGASPKYGTYQAEVDKFQNFLKFAGEKKSKESGLLFREHIPQSVFGVSTDEIASNLGKSENEFMAELTKDLNVIGGGSRSTQVLGRIKTKITTIKSMADALKLDPEFYKVVNSLDSQLGTIPSYKSLKPYKMTKGVSVTPTKETQAKIESRYEKTVVTNISKDLDEWQRAIRSETITPTQALNKGLKAIQEATNDSVKGRIAEETKKIFGISFRSPEYVFEKFGRKEDLWRPLLKGQESVANEIKEYVPKANDWYKRAGSKTDRRIIAQWLDGESVTLNESQLKVAQEVKSYYAEWADKIGLPEDARISDYLTHIFEPDLAGNKRVFPEELSRILDYITPSKVFNPFLEKRTGAKGYKLDYLEAMDAYVFRSARKLHLDTPLENAATFVKNMPEQAAKYTDAFLKNFQNRPSDFEKALNQNIVEPLPSWLRQKIGNRPISRLINAVTGQVYRGTIGLNITSPLKNLTQGVNTLSQIGPKYTTEGYMKLFSKGSAEELANNNVLDDMIIAEYRNSGIRGKVAKMDKALFYLFELTERINRGSAYFGAKAKYLKEGMNESAAIEAAKDLVRKTQFGYGKLHAPLALQSPIGKLGFQLSTFAIKQGEFVGGMAKNKQLLPLVTYILASLAMTYASKKFLGNIVGLEYQDAVVKNVMPHLGPIPSFAGNFYRMATTTDESEREYYADKIKRSMVGLFIPGGTQAIKTIEGGTAVSKGYDETKKGMIKFPIEQSLKNYIVGLTAGKYRLPESETYYKEKEKPLGEKQSAAFRLSSDKQSIYDQIIGVRKKTSALTKMEESLKAGQVPGPVDNTDLDTAKLMFQYSGNPYMVFQDKLLYKTDTGSVTSLSLNFDIPKPETTGNETLDKEFLADYRGSITTAKNAVMKAMEIGYLTQDQAIKELEKLVAQAEATKTKKPKKITFKLTKFKAPTIKVKKTTKTKMPTIKFTKPKIKTTTPRKYTISP